MKKRIALVFVCIMILSLSGCGNLEITGMQNNTAEKKVFTGEEYADYLYHKKGSEALFTEYSSVYYEYLKREQNLDIFTACYTYSHIPSYHHFIHYISPQGNEMNFSFDSYEDVATCNHDVPGKSTLKILASNSYLYIYAWSSPLDSMKGAMKYNDKEAIVTANINTIYTEGDYYEFFDEETYGKAIFKITRPGGGVYEGYAVYIDDYTTMTTYQFNFVIEEEKDEENKYWYERHEDLVQKMINTLEIHNVSIIEEVDETETEDAEDTVSEN